MSNQKKLLKEKLLLEQELYQIKIDKLEYLQKRNFDAMEKASIREKELNAKLNSLNSPSGSLKTQKNKFTNTKQKKQDKKINSKKQIINSNNEDNIKSKTKDNYSKRSNFLSSNNSKKMENFIILMKKGLSRTDAAKKMNLNVATVNSWYNKGSMGKPDYINFYKTVKKIEPKQNYKSNIKICNTCGKKFNKDIHKECPNCKKSTSLNPNLITCKKCGRKYNKTIHNNCPFCNNKPTKLRNDQTNTSKKKNIDLTKMEKIISLMKNGLSRSEAAQKMNLNVATVNSWYNKGSMGEPDYIKFYKNVKNIESINKTKNSTKLETCKKCGKEFDKNSHSECPHCKQVSVSKPKTVKSSSMTTCNNCGKEFDKNSHSECPHCKSNPISSEAKINENGSKFNKWIILGVLIIIIAILVLLLRN